MRAFSTHVPEASTRANQPDVYSPAAAAGVEYSSGRYGRSDYLMVLV